MGRSGVKRLLKSKVAEQVTDITLSDCADNPRKMNYRKSRVNFKAVEGEMKEADGDSKSDSEENEYLDNSDEDKKKIFKPLKNLNQPSTNGVVYPSDIWFLISRYLSPNDTCRFSLICKDAYNVICSARFWKQQYKRLINIENIHDLQIPYEFKVYSDTKKGLRARVIRLAFLSMPNLNSAIRNPSGGRAEPYTLQGMQLVLAWHEKERNHWNYFFKWKEPTVDLVKKHKNDLFENEEHGYRLLKVTCSDFICFPHPDQQFSYLSTVSLGLTSDMRHQKLTMGFSDFVTTHRTSKAKPALGQGTIAQVRIELSPITKCVLLDWWHPDYPYPRNSLRQVVLPCNDEEW